MNNLPRILLIVGAIVLALLAGIMIGRGERAEPVAGNAQAVQIMTAPPPSVSAPLPPPPPVAAPAPAAVPKIAPDLQVQEDAAAVGMTTREGEEAAPAQEPAKTTAGREGESANAQPVG